MLNKKQSKKRNSWKYAMILPALAAFMLLFQVKVVAQENPAITSTSEEKTKISVAITKDTSDEQMADEVEVFKDEFDAEVTFSEVKRNAAGEITAIKVTVKDKTQSQDHYVSGANGIKPFSIEMEKNSYTDGNNIAFGNANSGTVTANTVSLATVGSLPVAPVAPVAPVSKKVCTGTSAATCTINGASTNNPTANIPKGTLVVVNGVLQKESEGDANLNLPNGQYIANMNVLSAKEARKKYGKPGKKGAVEIQTQPGRNAYAFNGNDGSVNVNLSPLDMESIIAIAADGVAVGMDAVANIDWNTEIKLEGMLTEAERNEIREEIKKASIEAKKAMKEAKIEFDKEKYKEVYKQAAKDGAFKQTEMQSAMKEMQQAREQMEKAQKELIKAQKELDKAQKEMDKKKALNKKS